MGTVTKWINHDHLGRIYDDAYGNGSGGKEQLAIVTVCRWAMI